MNNKINLRNLIKQQNKIIASIISLFIITILILSGPASAFNLGLNIDGDSSVEKGKKITFIATVDINSGENIPINELVLVLDGPEHRECVFDITGKMKDGSGSGSGSGTECFGINIKKIPGPSIDNSYGYGYAYYGYGYNFGYGYGYTEQELEYEITVHTQHFVIGTYNTNLNVLINGKTFSKKGSQFIINDNNNDDNDDNGNSNGGCSTSWICGEWSECVDGLQNRFCEKQINYCYANPKTKPEESQYCEINLDNEELQETQETINQNQAKGRFSRITGAVTGTLGTAGTWVVAVFLIGILGLAITVPIVRYKLRYKKKIRFY